MAWCFHDTALENNVTISDKGLNMQAYNLVRIFFICRTINIHEHICILRLFTTLQNYQQFNPNVYPCKNKFWYI